MIRNFILLLTFLTLSFTIQSKEYLVQLKTGASLPSHYSARKIADNIYLIKTFNKFTKINLSMNSNIEIIEENLKIDAPIMPESMTSKQWGLYGTAGIKAKKAWNITEGSKDVLIAIIDTGIDYNHPDLKENIWTNEAELNGEPGIDDDGNGYVDDIHGYDFLNHDGDPMDDHSHGTHCAGIIGAVHNDIGVNGVMAHVKMMPLKFIGKRGGSVAGAIEAIEYGIKMHVDIMSNSWGGGGYSVLLENAIKKAEKAGILFVAAAGNDGQNNNVGSHYPSNFNVDNIIAVAAHNKYDGLAYFSNYGSNTVDVSAPGQDILSTVPNNKYKSYSGTSMATPFVSGIAGLLLSVNPSLSPEAIKDILTSTVFKAEAYSGKLISEGRVDAEKALLSL